MCVTLHYCGFRASIAGIGGQNENFEYYRPSASGVNVHSATPHQILRGLNSSLAIHQYRRRSSSDFTIFRVPLGASVPHPPTPDHVRTGLRRERARSRSVIVQPRVGSAATPKYGAIMLTTRDALLAAGAAVLVVLAGDGAASVADGNWAAYENGALPGDAIAGGHDTNGQTLYFCRVYQPGGAYQLAKSTRTSEAAVMLMVDRRFRTPYTKPWCPTGNGAPVDKHRGLLIGEALTPTAHRSISVAPFIRAGFSPVS